MLKTKTFTDVLLETFERSINPVRTSEGPSYRFNAGWESTLDAYGMSQIMVQTPTFKFRQSKAYRTPKTKRPISDRVFADNGKPAHLFNETQSSAFEFLRSLIPQLPENFSISQLKSAYRRAALLTHPDRGGRSESFQQVKKSYQILTALVKNEA